MYFILPTLTLFTISAAARALQTSDALDVSPAVGHLRGGETAVDTNQRDLAVSGTSSSKSLSTDVSLFKCLSFEDACCFNYDEFCATFTDSYAWTSADGTDARVLEELYVAAECEAAALTLASAYVEIRGTSSVDVKAKTLNAATDIDISLKLKTATLTSTLAVSTADASAATTNAAVAYTDAKAVCGNPTTSNSPLCKARSGSIQLGTATAGASSYGFTGALGGSSTSQATSVDVLGSSIAYTKAVLLSFAESFAASSSSASAYASAYTAGFTANFNKACLTAWDNHCGGSGSSSYCSLNRQDACNAAFALAAGLGYGEACAGAFGEACAEATAHVKLGIILKVKVAGPTGAITLEQNGYGEASINAFC